MEITVFLTYIVKLFFSIKDISSKPLVFITCTPALTIPVFSTSIRAFILLAFLFIIDFITGIAASCIEFRKSRKKPERGKKYVIESSKMRLSAVKFSTYGMGILIAYGLEWVFILEDFNLHSNLHKISLSTLITAFFCVIEFYSIFFENARRMGFDIIQKIKNISHKGWDIYNTIKNNESSKHN